MVGACMAGRHVWQGAYMAGWHLWQGMGCACVVGACMAGVDMCGRGACVAGGMHGGSVWWLGCVWWGVHGRGHAWKGGMHGRGGQRQIRDTMRLKQWEKNRKML